ncbi:hypothetical protein GCK72_006165 [Caenorhabditis remanei]|uniref:Uncharacterized protein n=1 Tax=Caenorhabditis remanei TaxID=31234 RepID=A0A6A5HG36_CAERE|nr:hypothetical protein GCK72_006165 [Caenorhabditis remanei]KAF1766209.1 hypothetical protein GCK72_006165 [Caenorhabditis remanei]
MGYFAKLVPPYYKYPVLVFLFCEFVYSAFVLAISEAYYKSAALILPIAYRIFDDTVKKNKPGFDWSPEEKEILEVYKVQMLFLWVISAIGVILCIFVMIPQFFDFNDKKGNPSHLCLVRKKLAWVMLIIVAVYIIVLGIAVVWAWSDGGAAAKHFHTHFEGAEKEEIYITQLEEAFDCESDDDQEVAEVTMCWEKVNKTFISHTWLDILFFAYLSGHILVFASLPFFNKQLFKEDDDDYINATSNKLLDN